MSDLYFVQYGIEDDYYAAIEQYGEDSDEVAGWAECSDLGTWDEARLRAIECLVEWCESTVEGEVEVAEGIAPHEVGQITQEYCERYMGSIQKVLRAKPDSQVTIHGPIPGEIIHINAS